MTSGVNERIRVHLEHLLALPHGDWWELPQAVRSDLERVTVPVPSEFQVPDEDRSEEPFPDPHRLLARELDLLPVEAILLEWESWLDQSQPWMADAVRRTDALPQEDDGGRAFAAGSFRLSRAIPLSLLRMKTPDRRLARRVLRLGICEEDPSGNRDFIEPALRSLGLGEVVESYLEAFQSGDTAVRAGVANAMYWTRYDPGGISGPEHPGEDPDRLRELRAKLGEALVDGFLAADESKELHFMQCSFGMIGTFTPSDPTLRAKLRRCVEKAEASGDPYLRSRISLHGGKGGAPPLLLAKPHRSQVQPTSKPWWKLW
jgi:hypothetical protein